MFLTSRVYSYVAHTLLFSRAQPPLIPECLCAETYSDHDDDEEVRQGGHPKRSPPPPKKPGHKKGKEENNFSFWRRKCFAEMIYNGGGREESQKSEGEKISLLTATFAPPPSPPQCLEQWLPQPRLQRRLLLLRLPGKIHPRTRQQRSNTMSQSG